MAEPPTLPVCSSTRTFSPSSAARAAVVMAGHAGADHDDVGLLKGDLRGLFRGVAFAGNGVLHSLHNTVGGEGSASHGVNFPALGIHDSLGNGLQGRIADASGLGLGGDFHRGDLATLYGNGHLDISHHALAASGVGAIREALSHGHGGKGQRHNQRHHKGKNLAHDFASFLSFHTHMFIL